MRSVSPKRKCSGGESGSRYDKANRKSSGNDSSGNDSSGSDTNSVAASRRGPAPAAENFGVSE